MAAQSRAPSRTLERDYPWFLMVRRASKAGRTGLNGMPSGCKLDVFQAGDQPAMRIAPGVIEPLFKLANRLFPQNVLNFLGVFMHVISCDVCGVGQIELPQTVI